MAMHNVAFQIVWSLYISLFFKIISSETSLKLMKAIYFAYVSSRLRYGGTHQCSVDKTELYAQRSI